MKHKSIYKLLTNGNIRSFSRVENLRHWLWHHRPTRARAWKEVSLKNRSFSMITVYRNEIIVDGELYADEVNKIRGPKMGFEIRTTNAKYHED